MAESSPNLSPIARKTQQLVLQRLASVGGAEAAKAMEVSEATVSRLKSEHLANFSSLLAVLGLKIVPANANCYTDEHMRSLTYFARMGMMPPSDDGARVGLAADMPPTGESGGPVE